MLVETIHQETVDLSISGTRPTPAETWQMMMRFSSPTAAEKNAMVQTVDVLLQRSYELVVNTYNYLQQIPETAEVLGWQHSVDESHLAERRRFFTLWVARTISMDMGTDFAAYLFRAGQVHAGHGKRQIHTPAILVTGSMGLVLGAFADYIRSVHNDAELVATALAGWNKYLMLQLNQMHTGYEIALELERGTQTVEITSYGVVRHRWGQEHLKVNYYPGSTVADILRKVLDYAPVLREVMFERQWEEETQDTDLWMRVKPVYMLRPGWRVQLNGKNLQFYGGFQQILREGDTLDLCSPGR